MQQNITVLANLHYLSYDWKTMEKEICPKCAGKMVLIKPDTFRCEKHRCETTKIKNPKVESQSLTKS